MPRIKLFEYSAKKILDSYGFPSLSSVSAYPKDRDSIALRLPPNTRFIVKVDQGVKGRMKKGLIAADISKEEVPLALAELFSKGYSRVIIEPFIAHDASEERYLSLERTREGVSARASLRGGIDIESSPESVKQCMLDESGVAALADFFAIRKDAVCALLRAFDECHFSFLEANPLLIRDGKPIFLDLAVLADSAGQFFCKNAWSENDVVSPQFQIEEERAVHELNAHSQASFSLSILNPIGSLFFLLSGGGASIVLADEAFNLGCKELIANYGEYSGNPSEDEAYAYAKLVLSLLKKSNAAKKALIIGGGVANFTNIQATFSGIRRALAEDAKTLADQEVLVYVRRGGPGEETALPLMKSFLSEYALLGAVYGPELPLSEIVAKALAQYAFNR